MKLNEIQDLIKFVAKSGVSEVELETKDVKITIKTNGKGAKVEAPVMIQPAMPVVHAPVAQPVVQAAPAEVKTPPTPTPAAADDSKLITVKSPMIGTFYRKAGPDKPNFVEVGTDVAPGKVVCIIEAMKLFNEIESEVKGRIVKVLVDDASPVEFDQPLFLVEPA